MKGLYYQIWADGIKKFRSNEENKGVWKIYAMLFTSMAMAFNFATVMATLEKAFAGRFSYDVNILFFRESRLNGFASFFILFVLIPLALNYLLVFRNDRYEVFITKYKTFGGKLYATYLVASFALPFILIIIGTLLI